MNSRPELKLDWCSHEAAKFACEHWHYSRSMPAGKTVSIGAWEEGFIGCVIFARGSNKYLGQPFGLPQTACIELVRVALREHVMETSRILAIGCRMLKKQSPGIRLIISFADMAQNHVGTLYQAVGWTYAGIGTQDSRSRPYRAKDGTIQHWRTVAGRLAKDGRRSTIRAAIEAGYRPLEKKPKHRYLFPLDAEMRKQILPLSKPYPKRARSETDDTPDSKSGKDGSAPILALQNL